MSLIGRNLGAKIQTNQSTSYLAVGQGGSKYGILRVEREKTLVPGDRRAAVIATNVLLSYFSTSNKCCFLANHR